MSNGMGPGFSTKAVQAGQSPEQWSNREVVPPISLATVYEQFQMGETYKRSNYLYARFGNPNRNALETAVAALENADHAITFGSTMAAINACFFALLKSGDHVVVHLSCYGETSVTCRNFEKFGVSHSIIHGNRLEDWIQAIKKGETRIVCIESPSNPMMTVTDIRQLSSEIKALDHEIMIIVDNSLMTSYLQQPLKLGADIVVHSLTKYMNGHNDAMMGAVCTSNKVAHDAIRMVQHSAGGVPSPFDCYLVNRGLKTLSLRMEKHSANALAIAEWLQHHDKVVKVFYPGLKSHPGHEVAVRQSPKGCSGTLSFYIKSTGPETAVRFLKSLHIFKIAGTFGGVNSLSDLPIRSSASQHTPEALTRLGIDHNLIRLAVGIEDLPDLIADLDQAFHHAV